MEIWNFGSPTRKCEWCGAIFWYEERATLEGRWDMHTRREEPQRTSNFGSSMWMPLHAFCSTD